MDLDDSVQWHLNLLARLLEAAGYAIDVDYAAATITIWIEPWPVHLAVKR